MKENPIYTLTSAARPRLADVDRETEAQVVYRCLEPYGSQHSLDQLIEAAKYRKIETLFTGRDNTVHACLRHHLNLFKKEESLRLSRIMHRKIETQ
jgi:hypothetical protein